MLAKTGGANLPSKREGRMSAILHRVGGWGSVRIKPGNLVKERHFYLYLTQKSNICAFFTSVKVMIPIGCGQEEGPNDGEKFATNIQHV